MKKLTLAVLAVAFTTSMAGAGIVDRIVAKVNDEIITLSELRRETEPFRQDIMSKAPAAQQEQALKSMEEQILNRMIEESLIYQRAIELEFNAYVEDDVSSYIQEIMKDNGFKDTEEFENALAQQGQSMRTFRETIERHMVSQALVSSFIDSRISLLTPEIERYYQNNQANYTTPEEVTLSEIILDTSKGVSEAEALATDIAERVRRGESFAELAGRHSKGATAAKGGGIGTYVIDKLNEGTRKALVGVNEGEVSAAQKSPEGLIIYRVDVRKSETVKPLDEVKDEIKEILRQQKRNPEYERFMTQLKEEAYIQIFPEMP
ncbi:MAG: SurA N-terminal domain-containing protein [Acidobacteriota bacterium]|jgi:peptidyl-prolyl cis-trans isomerase SurA|nr:SurA N-terminal domain-containing protein [Acidobacteriota bacterium]